MRETIRATLLGGLIFLIPLVFVVVTLSKAMEIFKAFAKPLSAYVTVDTVAGVAVVELLSGVLIGVACLMAGVIARSPWGQRLYRGVDEMLLNLIPGYGWIRGVTGSITDQEANALFKPVLVRFDDQLQLGFEVDRMRKKDFCVVFLPGAPDARSGAICYVEAERLTEIDADFTEITRTCKMLGRGSEALLGGKLVSNPV
jgi:uncharacterized membrane protein